MKLPKFYNPFKAHIVELANAKFVVRRWNIVAWEYKEHTTYQNDDIHWWHLLEYACKYCMVDSLDQAIALRDKTKSNPLKVVKVYG